MNQTRMSYLLVGTTVAALTLTACSGSSESSSNEIEVQAGLAADTSQFAALTELTEAYNEQDPDVKVKLVSGKPSYDQDIKVRLAARDAPDVFLTHGWSRDRYAEFLVPLQDEPWAKDLDPALDDAMRDESGAFFALPLNTSIAGVVYNETVLESVGVDPATLTTWDAFDAAVEKVAEKGLTGVAAAGKENWTAGNVADFIATGYYDEDQLAELQEGSFDEATYEAVLSSVKGWADVGGFNKDYTSATGQDIAQLLATDQVAFVFQANDIGFSAQQLNPEVKVGFMPVPSAVGDPYLLGGEDFALGVSKDSAHKEDALKYLEFLAEPENVEKMAVALGDAPGLTSATSELGIMQASYDKWVTEAATPVEPYFDRVYLPNGIWDTMVTTTDAMIVGQSSPQEGAQQMATTFQSLYGQD